MNHRRRLIIEDKMDQFQIITFYEFREIDREKLSGLRERLKAIMRAHSIKGTIILATEGFNSTVCGSTQNISNFVADVEEILQTRLEYKSSAHAEMPFRRVDVKIQPEIVTLKRQVDLDRGVGTHVSPSEWNALISDPGTIVLDARNDYEFRSGTFLGAVNPKTSKFSELPEFVENTLDPQSQKRVAMFCTGGIRCEKFAPYMKQLGFDEVYQLKGGILKYLEEIGPDDSLWKGECFVFDDRVSIDLELKKGKIADLSQKLD